MREYKNFRIHATAVPHRESGWYPRGIVLDPDPNVRREFERVECRNVLYHTVEEAEEAAFELCKHWIDKSFKAMN